MASPLIYWFRNDLRLHDNVALNEAVKTKRPIVFVYIIDNKLFAPTPFGFPRASQHRLNLLYQTLNSLKLQLKKHGSILHILKGSTLEILIQLAETLKADSIFGHREYASEEITEEQELALKVKTKLFWDNMIYPPNSVPFEASKSQYYYTRFNKAVTPLPVSHPLQAIDKFINFDHSIEGFKHVDLGEPDTFITDPTDLAESFINSAHLINYQQTREHFEGNQYSTFLSPYLANGSLSVRWFYYKLNEIDAEDDVLKLSIQKLKDQLIWRDYYRYLFLRYGNKLFTRHGIRNKNRERYDDEIAFKKWQNGETEHSLINAFMRELKSTGFLSNRGRMLAAYYLSKELQVNWLWGAMWFEHCLIDYDVCNNYGNWAYQSGVGTDSRFNRKFNIDNQVKKFDPKQAYIKKWTS